MTGFIFSCTKKIGGMADQEKIDHRGSSLGGFSNKFHHVCNTFHVIVQLIKLGGGAGSCCFLNEILQDLTQTLLSIDLLCRAPNLNKNN